MTSQTDQRDLFWDRGVVKKSALVSTVVPSTRQDVIKLDQVTPTLSLFEAVFTSYPPILESLLAQIATPSVLDLYHSSRHLRHFLRHYPLAWKTLSFRLPQPVVTVGSPGNETPDARDRQSKAYSCDALLKQIISPCGTRLTSLDLCNTAVSGTALGLNILGPRGNTLQHLSVRGCKNVSIKYHIVPFLEPFTMEQMPDVAKDLALKSLYVYRCRHHRRRPYLPSSLIRRDSDSDPTHQLIDICHKLGIWTDTAWCPTPGGRCFRRKDYHAGRAGPQNNEVWVPFDRLWRSSNRLGPTTDAAGSLGEQDGRLWEIFETGQDGEPLGTGNSTSKGEGKHVPAHLRKSHTMFTQDIQCAHCSEIISERCESCSVRMHCMGCRKTLCASCAFNRPLPRKRVKTRHFADIAFGPGSTPGSTLSQASGLSSSSQERHQEAPAPKKDRYWWAPGAARSPNLMNESTPDDDASESEEADIVNNGVHNVHANRDPPKLNMHWCCLEPIFSGGGGIAVLGTGLGGRGADKIRAAPLPRQKQFEDPDFSNQLRPIDYIRELKSNGLYEYVLGEDVDLLSYLKQGNLDLQAQTCPRGLCNDCYRSFRWKVSCRTCKKPICKEHDFRALKFRKCGYRDMHVERDHVLAHNENPRLVIPDFDPNRKSGRDTASTPTASSSTQDLSLSSSTTELATSETLLIAHSQILPASGPTSVEMSATTSLTSLASTKDPFSSIGTLPFVPVNTSRPRSLSVSGVRSRNTGSWPNSPRAPTSTASTLPLPCNPRHPVQWEGCGAYFCQYLRPIGDNRSQCPSIVKECFDCGVLVCDQCNNSNPACTCSYCALHFHCPVCIRKKDVKKNCRHEAEMRIRKEAELRAKEKLEKEKEERGQADEMAGAVFDFFAALLPQEGENGTHHIMLSPQTMPTTSQPEPTEVLTPSPESIIVTTVFGVHEEPSNITIISASGPSPNTESYSAYDSTEDNAVELTEYMTPAMENLSIGPSSDHDELAVGSDSLGELQDDGDDADIDTDEFDAESALVDEFIDDGASTPTTTATTSNL